MTKAIFKKSYPFPISYISPVRSFILETPFSIAKPFIRYVTVHFWTDEGEKYLILPYSKKERRSKTILNEYVYDEIIRYMKRANMWLRN